MEEKKVEVEEKKVEEKKEESSNQQPMINMSEIEKLIDSKIGLFYDKLVNNEKEQNNAKESEKENKEEEYYEW